MLALALFLATAPYDEAKASLVEARARVDSREEARTLLHRTIVDELIPAWLGTPWAFYGTSEAPRRGTIACGYFVTTILRDAGFRVERVKLAQQASERIVKSVVLGPPILRFRDVSAAHVVKEARARGDGIWIVGLDFHAGFLVIDGARSDFCHASFEGRKEVVCEPAVTSPGFESRYRVIGKLFDDAAIDRWLGDREFPTM